MTCRTCEIELSGGTRGIKKNRVGLVTQCFWCEQGQTPEAGDIAERDEAYERAAAHARGNDFEETDGRDWT